MIPIDIASQWFLILMVALGLSMTASAQATSHPWARLIPPMGAVTAIDLSARQISIKTDAGPEMVVLLRDETRFLRISPGQTDLKNAEEISLADVSAGDRILARGDVADNRRSVTATSVIVISKADIARRQAADRSEWDKRGISGTITALDPQAKEITISVHSLAGAKPVAIALAANAVLRRYAPDSVKFADAKPSRFEELRAGDQVRARGSKNENGNRFIAEQLVSGSFRNTAATVVSINASEGTLRVTDLVTKKPLLVRINADSRVRRVPQFVAQMLAWRAGASGQMAPKAAAPGARGLGGTGALPGGNMGAGRPRDLQSMIERMPAIALADLKPGEDIIVAATEGAQPDKVTAITVLAGVESILRSQSGAEVTLGSWNLDLNMGAGLQ